MNANMYLYERKEQTDNKSKKIIFFCLLAASLILFGTHHWSFSLLAFIISVYVIIFHTSYSIPYLLFLVPMASIFKLSPGSMSILTFLQIIFVGYRLFQNKKTDIQLIKILILVVYVIIVSAFFNSINAAVYIKLLSKLMFVWVAYHDIYDDYGKINIYVCAYAYIFGVLVSIAISQLNSHFFHIGTYTLQVIERFGATDSIIRFSGLAGDPNYFVLGIIISLCLCVFLVSQSKMNFLLFCIIFITLFLVVAATASKSGMIMLAWPVFVFLRSNTQKRKYGVLIIGCLGLVTFTYLMVHGQIQVFDNTMKRMNTNSSDVSSITTGRTQIWYEYIKYLINNPIKALFGNGATTYILKLEAFQNKGKAVHNAYLDLIYQLGLVGTGIFIHTLYSSMVYTKMKRNICHYSIYITIAIMYMFLNQFSDYEWPYHLLLASLVFNENAQKEVIKKAVICHSSKYIKDF